MIVYNLTDVPPPGQPKRGPQTLRIFGKFIAPGQHGEFPDDSPLGKISGWVYTGKVGVDVLPTWYKAARRAASTASRVEPHSAPKLVTPKVEEETVLEAELDTDEANEDESLESDKGKYKKKGKKK